MPYIGQEARERMLTQHPMTVGELNYSITQMCRTFLKQPKDKPTYTHYNEIIGVLECVKQEFYRRACVPFEDNKRIANGDVY